MKIFTFAKSGHALLLAAALSVGLTGCGDSGAGNGGSWDNDGGGDPGNGGGTGNGGAGTWLESKYNAKLYNSDGDVYIEYNYEYEWTRYTNDKDCEYQINGTTQTNQRTETATATITTVGSSQITTNSSINGNTSQSTSHTIGSSSSSIVYTSPTMSDVNSSSTTESTTSITTIRDEESGLSLSWVYQFTTSTNGQTPVTSSTTYNNTITLINTAEDGTKIYKSSSSEGGGAYTEYTIKNGVTMKSQYYKANGELQTTHTYSFPDNSTIRSRLPSFTINENEVCELISSTSSEMTIRVKEYSDSHVLTIQKDTIYKKR